MTGEELRARRRELGLTQRALAEALGIPQSTVWRWETDQIPIERPPMLALALEALGRRPRTAVRRAKKPAR